MEFFSDNWLLWTCFLVPSLAVLAAQKAAGRPLRLGGLASVVAFLAAFLLGMGLIHVFVSWLIP